MKIGVLTFHFVYNYGAMLQAYALSHYLSRLDQVECEVIDYRPRTIDFLYHPDWTDFCNHPKVVLRNYLKKKMSCADFQAFEHFINTYFVLSNRIKSDLEFERALNQYDAVFVGSDQVWNPSITGFNKNYLLQNSKKDLKKFSYAASIGRNEVNNEWRQNLKLLSEFEKISVREESAGRIIKEIIPGKEVRCIVDPVFLFTPEEWREMEKKVEDVSKYLLFYSLNNSKALEIKAEELSRQSGLKVVSIHPLYKSGVGKSKCNIGPEQFLWLIDHAEYVCTDSFHATAFSAIFSKRIIVQYDTGKGNRIRNILEVLGEKTEENLGDIDIYSFFGKNRKLEKLKDVGRGFIKECME